MRWIFRDTGSDLQKTFIHPAVLLASLQVRLTHNLKNNLKAKCVWSGAAPALCTCTERWRQGARQQRSSGSGHSRCPNRRRRACVGIGMSELIWFKSRRSWQQDWMTTIFMCGTPWGAFRSSWWTWYWGTIPFHFKYGDGSPELRSLGFCWGAPHYRRP